MSIAHFAYQPATARIAAPGFQALLELMRRGNTWMKISGANRVSATDPSGGGTTSLAYDLADRLVSVTDPDNNTTTYLYDNANRVTTVTDPLQVADLDGTAKVVGTAPEQTTPPDVESATDQCHRADLPKVWAAS